MAKEAAVVAEKIKSGTEIVKEFLEGLNADKALDPEVVEGLARLHTEGKHTPTRLLQELARRRKESLAHD